MNLIVRGLMEAIVRRIAELIAGMAGSPRKHAGDACPAQPPRFCGEPAMPAISPLQNC